MIEKILVDKYKIPHKYLNVINNCEKKKKKWNYKYLINILKMID